MAEYSPVTDTEDALTEDDVFEILWFRMTATDEEWEQDPASSRFDLTREQAATRIDAEDYSPI